MLFKYSGKYVNIYFTMKITFQYLFQFVDNSEIGRYDSGNDGSSLPLRNGISMQFFK